MQAFVLTLGREFVQVEECHILGTLVKNVELPLADFHTTAELAERTKRYLESEGYEGVEIKEIEIAIK